MGWFLVRVDGIEVRVSARVVVVIMITGKGGGGGGGVVVVAMLMMVKMMIVMMIAMMMTCLGVLFFCERRDETITVKCVSDPEAS